MICLERRRVKSQKEVVGRKHRVRDSVRYQSREK